jgi:hypothetical protein
LGNVMRQRSEDRAQKNALAAYAKDPNEQTFGGLAEAAPEYAMRARSDMEAQQARQQQQQQQQMGTVRQLLAKAGASPEGWAQAMGAAQQLGIDTSTIPQQYDPAWAQQQLFIMDALERDQDQLPGIAQELQAAGYQPGTPEFAAAMRQVINSKYASDYVDSQGNTRRRSVLDLGGGQGGIPQIADEAGYNALPAGAEYIAPDGSRRRKAGATIQNTPAPELGANGMPQVLSRQQYQATVASMGQAATDAWMQRNNIRMGN